MKKFLKNLIQGWNFIDAIFIAIYIIAFVIFAHFMEVPFFPAFFGILPLLGALCLSKKTPYSNILGIILLGSYLWFLWDFGLMGDFMAVIFQIPVVILSTVLMFKNKTLSKDKFNKWDILTLFACVALLSYPFYLLLCNMNSNYAIFQTIIFNVSYIIIYLTMKNVQWAKHLGVILTALQLTVYILFIVNVEIATVSFGFAILMVLIYQIVNLIIDVCKHKKTKSQTK